MKVVKVKGIKISCVPKFMNKKSLTYYVGSEVNLVCYTTASKFPWDPHITRRGIITNIVQYMNYEMCYTDTYVCIQYQDKPEYVRDDKICQYPKRAIISCKEFCKAVFANVYCTVDPSDLYMCQYDVFERDMLVDRDGHYRSPGDTVLLYANSPSQVQAKIMDINFNIKGDIGRAVINLQQVNSYDHNSVITISKHYNIDTTDTVKKYNKYDTCISIPNVSIRRV